jgi:hypothetical protein
MSKDTSMGLLLYKSLLYFGLNGGGLVIRGAAGASGSSF